MIILYILFIKLINLIKKRLKWLAALFPKSSSDEWNIFSFSIFIHSTNTISEILHAVYQHPNYTTVNHRLMPAKVDFQIDTSKAVLWANKNVAWNIIQS